MFLLGRKAIKGTYKISVKSIVKLRGLFVRGDDAKSEIFGSSSAGYIQRDGVEVK